MIKTLIIEDEAIAARNLQRMLNDLEHSIEVTDTLDSVEDAVSHLQQSQQDLIFLDIHLSDGNAFQIFEQIDINTPIIFTTAYDQYAIKAFEQNSVHYLLKPINQKELSEAIGKYQNLFSQTNAPSEIDYQKIADLISSKKTYQQNFLIQIGRNLKPIDIEQVAYFFVKDKTTYLTTYKNRSYPLDLSLSQLEDKTNPDNYFRINRQYLISRKAINEIYYLSTTRLKVELNPKSEQDILVTIDKIGRFKKWLNQ